MKILILMWILVFGFCGDCEAQTVITIKRTQAAKIFFPLISPLSSPPECNLLSKDRFIEYEIAFTKIGGAEVKSVRIPGAANVGADGIFMYELPMSNFYAGSYLVQSRWKFLDDFGREVITSWCELSSMEGCLTGCPDYSTVGSIRLDVVEDPSRPLKPSGVTLSER